MKIKAPVKREPAWTCIACGHRFRMEPYDIGSGPEVSCPSCEWCWGAEGQDLKPLARPVGGLTLFFDNHGAGDE
jgi:hypothetical protein